MNDLNPLPPCAEYEYEIVELREGALTPERAVAVRAHLDSCARCRAWQAAFAAVDAQLATALARPALTPDFVSKLGARIAAETRRAPVAELRTTADDEYRHALAALRQGVQRNALLTGLTLAGATLTGFALAPTLLADAAPVLSSLSLLERVTVFGTFGGVIALAALAWSAMQGVLPSGWSRA